MKVKIDITSKKDCYSFEIREKVTFIQGDSGTGKSSFARAVDNDSGLYEKNVTSPYTLFVLTEKIFMDWYDRALLKKKNASMSDSVYMRNYWLDEVGHLNRVFIIDDESYVAYDKFLTFFECCKNSYFIFISRQNLKIRPFEVCTMVVDGRLHTLNRVVEGGNINV